MTVSHLEEMVIDNTPIENRPFFLHPKTNKFTNLTSSLTAGHMDVLIIEDEKYQAKMLEKLLEKQNITIKNIVSSVADAIAYIPYHKVDLIFMDVELKDGVCFDIFAEIEVSAPVIFVTNHTGFSLDAFYSNGIHYLVKPITKARLDEGLAKYHTLKQHLGQTTESTLSAVSGGSDQQTSGKLLFKVGKKSIPFSLEGIGYFLVSDGFVYLHTKESKKYLIDHNIEEILQRLPASHFFRLNRQCITNIELISSFSTFTRGRIKVEMKPYLEESQLVSFKKRAEFLEWINQNI
ncbi:MAG: LytTR family DNA-binding domain-containing protein [Cyclobacteriaceae bacterium]